MPTSQSALLGVSLIAAVAVVIWSSLPGQASDTAPAPATSALESAAALRLLGPAGLEQALAHYDALPPGPERKLAAERVDKVAAQKYATRSRLFWHTELATAQQAARAAGKPILSLRLLGRLDEDFSCANSRMFRTVLYADPSVSAYLRDTFILHWSSEREVPKISIDFGDGRVMKSTIAGNSAHYILSPEGQPLDVIPGLYAPLAFVEALKPGAKLAASFARAGSEREALLLSYHQAQRAASAATFAGLPSAQRKALEPFREVAVGKELMNAEVLTVSKMMIETPMAREFAAGPPPKADPQAVLDSVAGAKALSEASAQLIAEIGPTDWSAQPSQVSGRALATILAELSRRVASDTLINEHGLRPKIRELFIASPLRSFADLNSLVYSEVFLTPASDPWLGMAQPEGFTGLPRDGLALAN